MGVVQEQPWSEGNVRGLRNFMEKIIASIPVNKEVIGVEDVLEEIPSISTWNEEKDSYGICFYKGFTIKDVEHWAKAVACIEHLKEVLTEFDSIKVGERERQEVKKRLDIKNDGTFYINIENGITIAFRFIREKKGHASESDVLKFLSADAHKALSSFILDKINRKDQSQVQL